MKKNSVLFISFLIGMVQFSCQSSSVPKESAEGKKSKGSFCLDSAFRDKIELQKAQFAPYTLGTQLNGIVQANPDKVICFVSMVGGIVTNTHFSLGDFVKKGQVLAELRSAELMNLETEKNTLMAEIKVAQRALAAAESMFKDGLTSEKDLLQAESDVLVKKMALDKVEALLGLYSASSQKGVFMIKAPASGYITEKNINTGMHISSEGESLFTISDLNEVWVMANIYARNITQVEQGQDVDIKTLSYPNEVFKGKISALAQVFDDEERVLKARIVMKNKDLKLKPGMLVDVYAKQNTSQKALAIATKGIIFDDNQYWAVIYEDDCQLSRRKVQIMNRSNGTTFIEDGIAEGEQVIIKNTLLVYEKLKNL